VYQGYYLGCEIVGKGGLTNSPEKVSDWSGARMFWPEMTGLRVWKPEYTRL
jgi:hypothetical protein